MDALAPTASAELADPHVRLDELEQRMLDSGLPAVDLPLTHRFTPGLYVREIFMPAGTLCTSKIHRTQHPYAVLEGRARVLLLEGDAVVGVEEVAAGHLGITEPGTRRALYIVEDCRWATFHPLTEAESEAKDVAMIEARIIEPRELPDGSSAHRRYLERLAPELLEASEQYEYGGAP